MQGDRNRLSRIWLQHYGRPVNSHTPLCLAAERRKLLRDQTVKPSSCPTRFHEQSMDLCEGIDAAFDHLLEIIRRIGRERRTVASTVDKMFFVRCSASRARLTI